MIMNMQSIIKKPKFWRSSTSLKSVVLVVKTSLSQGTTYFSAEAIINGKYSITLRFQNGYESGFKAALGESLTKLGMIDFKFYHCEFTLRNIRYTEIVSGHLSERDVRLFGKGGI